MSAAPAEVPDQCVDVADRTGGEQHEPVRRTRSGAAREGIRDITPMVIGVVPFGLALGATVGASSIDPWAGIASAPLILAGAAQLATLQGLETGTHPVLIVVSAILINVRLLLYGASLAPWFRGVRLRTRLLIATTVVDQIHLTCTPRFERGDLDGRERVAYYAGAAIWLASAFVGAQVVALTVGAELPESARLEMAAPFALLGLVAKSLGSRPSAIAGLVASVVVTFGAGLPFHSAVLVATLVGISAAVVAERRTAEEVTS